MSFSNTNTGSQNPDPYKEKNRDAAPSLKENVEDLLAFAEKQKFCMMTTRIADSGLLASRCMAIAAKDEKNVELLFHANSESGKTDDLEKDSHVNLAFLNPAGEWASISGSASIETDRKIVEQHYSPALKAWLGDLGDGKHDGGPQDPRIVLIKVKAVTAQYAVLRRTAIGSVVEIVKGAISGEAPSVNKLRYLNESDISAYRSGSSL